LAETLMKKHLKQYFSVVVKSVLTFLIRLEETLRALDDLQAQGKILYPAVSNWAAWQIAKALGISAREQLARFELLQPMYSLVKRQAEVEILPLAVSEQLGVISYSPLGGGLLTGKYGVNKRPKIYGSLCR
jgi:aryl-alcohol dehydrogenase-like predicted oxidoreductase